MSSEHSFVSLAAAEYWLLAMVIEFAELNKEA
jgi:hypothetical protein